MTGILIPAAWPRATQARLWWAHRRALTALYPLWARMCASVDGVALDPVPPRWRDRLRVRDLDYVLYRRIIEIWDAQRLLRQYVSRQAHDTALAAAQRRGLVGDHLAAAVEAANIDTALRATTRHPPSDVMAAYPIHATRSLAAEVRWWRSVAAEFTTLPSTETPRQAAA